MSPLRYQAMELEYIVSSRLPCLVLITIEMTSHTTYLPFIPSSDDAVGVSSRVDIIFMDLSPSDAQYW